MKTSTRNWTDILRYRLTGAKRIAIVGIGDELLPTDRLGMLAAQEIRSLNLPGLKVFLAGTVPETVTGPIRTFCPDNILLLDAADMGINPGTADVLPSETIGAGLLSTHALPLSIVIEYLEKETGATVTLLGIQPVINSSPSREPIEDQELLAGFIADLTDILRDAERKSLS